MAIIDEEGNVISNKKTKKKSITKKASSLVWQKVWFLWEREERFPVWEWTIIIEKPSSVIVNASKRGTNIEENVEVGKNRIREFNE